MPYTWRRGYHGRQHLTSTTAEWEEVWNVYGYVEPAGGVALFDLLADRPDLATGQEHPTVDHAYVTDGVRAERIDTSEGHRLVVPYKIEVQPKDQSPLDRPAEMSLESETVEVPTFRRLDGSLILNTAGDLIHGLTRKVNRRIFNYEKNVAAIPSWLFDYSDNAVNSDSVTIEGQAYNPGYLMLQKVRGTPYQSEMVSGAPVFYRTLTFSLVYDPRGWDEKVYNRGLRELVAASGSGSGSTSGSGGGPKLVWIMDENQDGERTPTDEPRFLDEDGRALATPINPADVIEIDGVGVTSLPFNSVLPLT